MYRSYYIAAELSIPAKLYTYLKLVAADVNPPPTKPPKADIAYLSKALSPSQKLS